MHLRITDSSSSFVFSLSPAGAELEEEDNEEDDDDLYNSYDQEEDTEEEDIEMACVPAAAALPAGQGSGWGDSGRGPSAQRSPP